MRGRIGLLVFIFLFSTNVFIWSTVLANTNDGILTVSFLDVGQGDAIFIEAPNGSQVLIDGGPDKSVIRELSQIMPFYDRTIDVIIATHPDKDHIGGLPEVLKRFTVSTILHSGAESDTAISEEFFRMMRAEEEEENAREILARRGMQIVLDQGVVLEILFPDRDTGGWESNTASIIARLSYGDTAFMLTGDAPKQTETYVAELDGPLLHSDVLKVGHHGSKTSTAEIFLGFVSPDIAIISAGVDNKYGHPHQEIIDMLNQFDIDIRATANHGTITVESDGSDVAVVSKQY